MPQEITAYQANDGSIHATACKAATCDLETLVKASPLNENQPYAKKLCEWLTNQATDIIDVLTAYRDACPIENKGEAASKQSEGTRMCCKQCGTPEDEPHPFRHIRVLVPCNEADTVRAYKKSPIPEGHDPHCDCHKSGDFADCDCLPEIRR